MHTRFIAVSTIVATLVVSVTTFAFAKKPDVYTICHASGLAGTTKFETLTLPEPAFFGHFDENGTQRAGHEQDYMGACVTATPTPTPRPTATPTPTPCPTPTASPSPTASPAPTATPTTTPTPTQAPGPTATPVASSTPAPTPVATTINTGKESKMAVTDPTCSNNNMDASIELYDNWQPVVGVNVKFTYENEAKYAKTESNGRAGVTFGYKTNSDIMIEPEDGYPAQRQKATAITNCSSTGSVLGTSTITSGKVLGMANTGVFDDMVANVAGTFGTLSTVIGTVLMFKRQTIKK